MLNAATAYNLQRKAAFVDDVQMRDGVPMFSFIDINVTELCNRSGDSPKACAFCPRIDPSVYPNQKLHLALPVAEKIGAELRALDYQGAVVLCGFGEPLLHPQIVEIATAFRGVRLEVVTNGDRLSHAMIHYLIEAGVSYFAVSMYDGPHQAPLISALFSEAGYGPEWYGLRDRWHGAEDDYGLKLTNRAGTIHAGNQPAVDKTKKCFYTAYQLCVDWNSDVLLCVQDWSKRIRYGNVNHQTLWDVWTSPAMHKRRMQLIRGQRDTAPCSACNAEGILHGANHAKAWTHPR